MSLVCVGYMVLEGIATIDDELIDKNAIDTRTGRRGGGRNRGKSRVQCRRVRIARPNGRRRNGVSHGYWVSDGRGDTCPTQESAVNRPRSVHACDKCRRPKGVRARHLSPVQSTAIVSSPATAPDPKLVASQLTRSYRVNALKNVAKIRLTCQCMCVSRPEVPKRFCVVDHWPCFPVSDGLAFL